MRKTVTSDEYEKAKGIYEGALWKTWADFAKAHDMIDASWFTKTEMFSEMDYYFTPDDSDIEECGEDYYPDIYEYYFIDRNTFEDIERFNIYTPYFEHYKEDIYLIGIAHWGTLWESVPMLYVLDDKNNEDD